MVASEGNIREPSKKAIVKNKPAFDETHRVKKKYLRSNARQMHEGKHRLTTHREVQGPAARLLEERGATGEKRA